MEKHLQERPWTSRRQMDGWLSLGHMITQSPFHHLPLLHHPKPQPPLHFSLPLLPSGHYCFLPNSLRTLQLQGGRAAAMKVLAVTSPVSARAQPRRRLTGSSSTPCQRLHSSFSGMSLQCSPRKPIHAARSSSSPVQVVMMVKPVIQFIQGTDEQTIPDIRLTKSRDGSNGVAIFTFDQPSVFDSSAELGDITGFYMIDEEGVVQSVDVSAKFVNGKPAAVEAKYVMRTPKDWDRFMRFMERYSQANGLQFVKN